MTREQMKDVFRKISIAYGNKFEVSTEKINYWHDLLKDLTYEQVEKNLISHVKKSVFPPTIADLNVKGTQYKPFNFDDYLRDE